MALFKCPECGREISMAAQSCPGCGCPMARPAQPKTSKGLLVLIGCLVAIPVLMVGVAVLGILAAIAIPSFLKARETSQSNRCVENLLIIDEAKEEWAEKNSVSNGCLIPPELFEQFLEQRHSGGLVCPKDPDKTFATSYEVGPVGVPPACRCDESHVLEYEDDPEDAPPAPAPPPAAI